MISTSSYNNWKSDKYRTYSISGNRGVDAGYQGRCYPELAPKKDFWRRWEENRGKVSDEKNNKYYIQEYYNQVLSKLDPEIVYRDLEDSVLLCYEDNMDFCHRHIVAAWFEILLGVKVPEQKASGYKVWDVERPQYIKDYLEEVMKLNKNMHGFKSLRAVYLFEKSEKYLEKADLLEEQNGENYDNYRQMACFLRCDADMAEDEYNEKLREKRLFKTK